MAATDKALGIGGVFIKAAEPAANAARYMETSSALMFTLASPPPSPTRTGGRRRVGGPNRDGHFDPSTQPMMVNSIVDDLCGLLVHAQATLMRRSSKRGG
jgi:hypothetical protein